MSDYASAHAAVLRLQDEYADAFKHFEEARARLEEIARQRSVAVQQLAEAARTQGSST